MLQIIVFVFSIKYFKDFLQILKTILASLSALAIFLLCRKIASAESEKQLRIKTKTVCQIIDRLFLY